MTLGKYGTTAGTLRKRGKIWYAVWMKDGKLHQVSTRKTIKEEAVKVLAEKTSAISMTDEAKILETLKGQFEKARRGRLPLPAALQAFLDDRTKEPLSETTLYAHRRRFGAFVGWMARNRPQVKYAEDLTLDDARAFIKAAAEGKSNKTFNDYRALLMQIWDALIRRNAADTNPWKLIDRRERLSVTRKELDAEQLARLVAAATGETRLLFVIGIYTGLRLKDAALLRWNQIDFKNGFIGATPFKTARHGTKVLIPMVEPLRAALAEAMGAAGVVDGGAFVLPDLAARYNRYPKGVSISVQRTFRKAGFDTAEDAGRAARTCVYGFHSFRHTFVSLAFEYGIPLPIVQAIVGHTNAAMTRHYLHIQPAELAAAMAKFKAIPATAAGMLPASGTDTPAEAAGKPADGAALELRATTPAKGADVSTDAKAVTLVDFMAAALKWTASERKTAMQFLASCEAGFKDKNNTRHGAGRDRQK